MNVEPEETGSEVPEADALEQRTPVLPESPEELPEMELLPDGVPQADFIDQGRAVQPGSAGYDGIATAEAEADEADLIEAALGLSADDEEDYPDAREDAG
ncbi:hypothetical protein QFZ79_000031 [Arthrobacter sp. V4I6]|uniref:hypothetical protein n=1 Tax=unclassified Arthrobacter TaxID=235627 RepID=UPI00278418AA|nr:MULTISPECIES: hypothetical protein [unclassified Arthrobacter]MDQ0822284.1 hypothetical protein [Arthrobacter sp. V1I7]MDQ0851920.1 hypothetical protein [Arthrobacter sp. V4I6]